MVDNTVVFRAWPLAESSKSSQVFFASRDLPHVLLLSFPAYLPLTAVFSRLAFVLFYFSPFDPPSYGAAYDGSLPDGGMSSTELTAAMSSSPHLDKGFSSDYYSPCTPVGDNTRSYAGSYNPAPKR